MTSEIKEVAQILTELSNQGLGGWLPLVIIWKFVVTDIIKDGVFVLFLWILYKCLKPLGEALAQKFKEDFGLD